MDQELCSFIDVVRERASRLGERRAFTFLGDGEEPSESLTYAGLDRRARVIAAELQRRGAAGERVLLLFPPGLDFVAAFLGCLYAGAVAVPAYPPSPGRGTGRLRSLLADAQPRLALTVSPLLERVDRELAGIVEAAAIDGFSPGQSEDWRPPAVGTHSLAFLQYTSGSTSDPKGVCVTHGNLIANERAIQAAFGQSEESVVLGWLPLYHDMGLIGNVLQPLWCGATCVLMSPLAFLQRPRRWLEAIGRFRATTSGGPDFAYSLCVRKVPPEEREGLDLSSWRVAFNGAEPVRAETLDAFADAFGPCGFRREAFYPCYGLAEATLFVSGGDPEAAPTVQGRLVGCGGAWPGERIAIVEGEIWVAGPSVAAGYWNRPEETERTFGACLDTGEGPFLRTGDLGILEEDGELFVTGRIKDLIVVRGRNLYPHDLERTAEVSHPALRPGGGAAFSVEAEGEERLVIVHEVERRREAEAGAAAEAIRAAVLREQEISPWDVVVIRAGTLPKTSSGKVRRGACREQYLAGALTPIPSPASPTALPGRGAPPPTHDFTEDEASLPLSRGGRSGRRERGPGGEGLIRDHAARLLRVDPGSLSFDAPLPLDSLLALELKNRLEAETGVSVSLTLLLDGISPRRLAAEISGRPRVPVLLPEEEGNDHPLSYNQRSLWLAWRMAPESAAYNLALAARVRSEVDPETLRQALFRLVSHHPILRTTYPLVEGEPVQRIGEVDVDFAVLDLKPGRIEEEAWRPFDLERGPALRVRLLETESEAPVLLLAVHHIAADFWSLGIILEELAREPGHLASGSYVAWSQWQRQLLAGPEGERLWNEWREALAGAPPVLDLPADRPRPPVPTHRGGSHPFSLGADVSDRVRSLAAASGATLYSVLLAAFEALLQRHTGRDDLLVGAPAAGRTRPGLEEVVGHFVSLLPVRGDLSGDPPFAELVARTRRAVAGALERQDFPFPLLVERLDPVRDASRPPLVQVLFALEQPRRLEGAAATAPFVLGRQGPPVQVGDLILEPVALPRVATPFDLVLLAVETGGPVEAALDFNADLFDAATASRLAARFLVLLAAAVADPSRHLSELPVLDEAERAQLFANATGPALPVPEVLAHELFESWADQTPEAPALIAADGAVITYAELEARANQLARHLQALGVGPETPVALLLERSPELWLSALATLKAGGYYVPIDPSHPKDRISHLIADSGAPVVVTMERIAAAIAERSTRRLGGGAGPEQLAYALYTSGSTGRPKGVLVTHRSLVNMVDHAARDFRVGPGSRMLQISAPAYDASVQEVFLAWTSGATLCLATEEARYSGPRLAAELRAQRITWAVLTPSAVRFLPEEEIPSLDTLVIGGEAVPAALAARWSKRVRLVNGYGPAEAAVYVASHLCLPGEEGAPPIGRPITNCRLHVLGPPPWVLREPLPIGVPGELCVGGIPPGRGYLGRPDLTAERWVPDPFSTTPGQRLYKTGDLARWRPDGRLDFLGRIDNQVKVRGVRIEPAEIEAALAAHPQVREAVVVLRAGPSGESRLVAYLVLDEDVAGELRAFLAERLPAAMIPSVFVALPRLPMTPVGKIDLSALPLPEEGAIRVLPRTEMERKVAAVWREVLGVESVGIDRNFFEVGGHSLLLARAHARLCEVLGRTIPLTELFSHTTISSLAARLTEEEGKGTGESREIHDRAAHRRAAMGRRRARGGLRG